MTDQNQRLAAIESKLDQVLRYLESIGFGGSPRRTVADIDRVMDAKVLKLTSRKKADKNP